MPDDSFANGASSDDPFDEFRDSLEGEEMGPLSSPKELSGMAGGLDPSLVLELARSWVREHQNTTMLGAFAVGVFVGSLLRN